MEIKIVEQKIHLDELKKIAALQYGDMIKGVVDIEKEVIAFGGEYHIDANVVLIANGSRQDVVWGFNLYINKPRDAWLEYTSLINIRPLSNNTSIVVGDPQIRKRMKDILDKKVIS